MDQHVGQEPPSLLSLVGIVYEYLGDGTGGVRLPLGGVIAEQYYLDYGYQYHTYGRRPAAILLFVCTVCVCEYAFLPLDCHTKHKGEDGLGWGRM